MFSSDIPDDWTPSPPPKEGSSAWKDDMAIQICIGLRLLDKTQIVKLPKCKGYDLGYMAIKYYSCSGTDYFRVDKITNKGSQNKENK